MSGPGPGRFPGTSGAWPACLPGAARSWSDRRRATNREEEHAMCRTDDISHVTPVEALPTDVEWKGEVLPLEPVDELSVLTVCDNTMDMLLPDEEPAKRLSMADLGGQGPMMVE